LIFFPQTHLIWTDYPLESHLKTSYQYFEYVYYLILTTIATTINISDFLKFVHTHLSSLYTFTSILFPILIFPSL